MTDVSPPHDACLRALPDLPRWVETRDLLLNDCDLWVGEVTPEHGCFVAWDDEDELASLVHWPDRLVPSGALLAGWLDAARRAAGDCSELLSFGAARSLLAGPLDGWSAESVAVFALGDWIGPGDHGELVAAQRFRSWVEEGRLQHLEAEVLEELTDVASDGQEIAVAFAQHDSAPLPVSFCYAASLSESLWDVSIDTVPSHRRRGHAQIAVRSMIEAMAQPGRGGRAPVWCAAASNPASSSLARRLGFIQVDAIDYWQRR